MVRLLIRKKSICEFGGFGGEFGEAPGFEDGAFHIYNIYMYIYIRHAGRLRRFVG